ncbi:hypothetical protein M3Y94_00321600 [Aphelenchoides besseyi]|nr:hypothetical protein M3Y94_00321600 [Aphelenchoides besseyi]KAI6235633.1 Nudix hydrolase domain-containing protein [Aphelenchoides besseyi]
MSEKVHNGTLVEEQERLKNVKFRSGSDGKYIKTFSMDFERKNVKLTWELAFEMDSVAAIIYHSTRKQLLCVKQFRPAVMVRQLMRRPENKGKSLDELHVENETCSIGYTVELCAGLCDKPNLTPSEVMREEILEECGYNVNLDQLEQVCTTVDVSASGAMQHVYFVVISEENKHNSGGGNTSEGEFIEKVWLDIDKLDETIRTLHGPPLLHYGIQYFMAQKRHLYLK